MASLDSLCMPNNLRWSPCKQPYLLQLWLFLDSKHNLLHKPSLAWLFRHLWRCQFLGLKLLFSRQSFKRLCQCINVISMTAWRWRSLFAAIMLAALSMDVGKKCAANIEASTAVTRRRNVLKTQTSASIVNQKQSKHLKRLLYYHLN